MRYQGTSPDEICLVAGAKQQGFVYLGRTSNAKVLNISNEEKEFEEVIMFEFDNDRKKMSVIIKDGEVYKLYTKGADNKMLDIMSNTIQNPAIRFIRNRLDEYSKKGLRTLCMGVRVLSHAEIASIQKQREEMNNPGVNKAEALSRRQLTKKNLSIRWRGICSSWECQPWKTNCKTGCLR